ncbi:MAG: c-type cytochrome [Burkholderiales bacterium]|jgi:cytochrome c oxidase cbb3-type subunit 3
MKQCMRSLACAGAVALALCACKREQRAFEQSPSPTELALKSGISLPSSTPTAKPSGSYEETAYAIAQGKQLFNWFNCTGCHSHGGGGIGPPLMDDKWIYGHEPGEIFSTIVEGRPNGMPSFRGRLDDSQVWQLVAYVRSMSALVRRDAIAGRDDGIQKGKPEQRRSRAEPRNSSEAPPQ